MTNPKINITAFTDGSCKGNPGPGGYGVVILNTGTMERLGEFRGRDPDTTNNRMERLGAIRALEWFLKIPEEQRGILTIRSDSEYVTRGAEEWLPGWKKNGWRKANKKPVENRDLWTQLDELQSACTVKFQWVKGHKGTALNEDADRIASEEAERARCAFPDDNEVAA